MSVLDPTGVRDIWTGVVDLGHRLERRMVDHLVLETEAPVGECPVAHAEEAVDGPSPHHALPPNPLHDFRRFETQLDVDQRVGQHARHHRRVTLGGNTLVTVPEVAILLRHHHRHPTRH